MAAEEYKGPERRKAPRTTAKDRFGDTVEIAKQGVQLEMFQRLLVSLSDKFDQHIDREEVEFKTIREKLDAIAIKHATESGAKMASIAIISFVASGLGIVIGAVWQLWVK